MNNLFVVDYYRATGKEWKWYKVIRLYNNIGLRYLFLLRKECVKQIPEIFHFFRLRMQRRYGLDINCTHLAEGMVIGHPHNISINSNAIIGKNLTIQNGATIGKDFRGKRCGTPEIGDNVYIGANATIVGKVRIGSDVLVAPNTFVNFDVPDHSIVIGVPGKIIYRDGATEGFILNKRD